MPCPSIYKHVYGTLSSHAVFLLLWPLYKAEVLLVDDSSAGCKK